jgi:parallel beta-helix repeat protein
MDLNMRVVCLITAVFLLSMGVGCSRPKSPPTPQKVEWRNLPSYSGYLKEDTLWRGRVLLDDDLIIPSGRTLAIESGTVVFIRPSKSTKIEPEWLSSHTELQVHGTLHVEGTAANPVYFLPAEEPEDGDAAWSGLLFGRGAQGQVSHAVIVAAESGVTLSDASPTIENSRFERCRYGAVFQGKATRPLVRGNRFEQGEGGLFCWWGSRPRLEENIIGDNEEEGLFIDATSAPELYGNRLLNNGIGVVAIHPDFSPEEVALEGNVISRRALTGPGGKP